MLPRFRRGGGVRRVRVLICLARRSLATVTSVALVLALALSTPVAAAEPPAGVLLDGTATVVVREPSPDGGATQGTAIEGAAVTLVAYLDDPAATIGEWSGTTDAGGTVVFESVARPDDGGPVVHLAADAYREVVTHDNGCVTTRSWSGATAGVIAAATVEVPVEVLAASSIECTPPPILQGTVHDADGRPIDVLRASVSIVVLPDGGAQAFPLAVDDDGAFQVELPAWGTSAEPALVTVDVISQVTRTEIFDEICLRSFAESGSASVEAALADQVDLPILEITTTPIVVGEDCGTVSTTPAPDSPGGADPTPALTLPPTDTVAATAAAADLTGAAVAAGGLALLGLAILRLTPRRRSA